MREPSANELFALTRLFSLTVIREFALTGKSPLWSRLLREVPAFLRQDHRTLVGTVYEQAFDVLKRPVNRHEYAYRAAVTNKILLGRHSLNTTTMLSEFRVGNRRADVVLLNGSSTAYEIKSEHDRLDRLREQVEAYTRVFAETYVVAGEQSVKNIIKIVPQDIGILLLNSRFQFTKIRTASSTPDFIDLDVVFDSLRTSEIKLILTSLKVEVPNMPNTLARSNLKNLFLKLKPIDVHAAMVRTLSKSRSQANLSGFIDEFPKSIRSAVISSNVHPCSYQRLLNAMRTPIQIANMWS